MKKAVRKKRTSFFTRRIVTNLIFALSVLFLIGSLFLLVEFGLIANPFTVKHNPGTLTLPDECSMIAGHLIHTIDSEEMCEMRCKTECSVFDMRFDEAVFIEKQESCNTCDCSCK